MHRLGVLGWPVGHSRSPQMHRAALAALGLDDWTYQRLPAPPELLADIVAGLPGAGFVGVNVTIPHKEAALALATETTPRARAIGATNTLTFGPDGSVLADNTDAPGLLHALGEEVSGQRALVLGAGGSARAAVHALVGAGADVLVYNRTHARAVALTDELGGRAVTKAVEAHLLVNCTAAGLADRSTAFKDLPIGADEVSTYATVVDLVYSDAGETQLVAAARDGGCRVIDGLEILVCQGALSLTGWIATAVPIGVMREAVRNAATPPPQL